jgi:adenylate kinase
MKRPLVVCLVGPSGCGKTSPRERLREMGLIPVVMSVVLRACNDRQINLMMDASDPVPDRLAIRAFQTHIENQKEQIDFCSQGFVLDGYPRTAEQVSNVMALFCKTHDVLFMVIDVSEEECWERILGAIAKGERKRADDTPSGHKKRYQIHSDNEESIRYRLRCIGSFKRGKNFFEIDGMMDKKSVLSQIDGALRRHASFQEEEVTA